MCLWWIFDVVGEGFKSVEITLHGAMGGFGSAKE